MDRSSDVASHPAELCVVDGIRDDPESRVNSDIEKLFECGLCGNAANICEHGMLVCCDQECCECTRHIVDAVTSIISTPKSAERDEGKSDNTPSYAEMCRRRTEPQIAAKKCDNIDRSVKEFINCNARILCQFCVKFKNIKFENGELVQIICEGCRVRIAKYPPNHCSGGSPDCMLTRWVDSMGRMSEMCNKCDRYFRRFAEE